ncbi:MAG: hypothetical protein ACYC7H_11195 [Chloroflexota bacterium]
MRSQFNLIAKVRLSGDFGPGLTPTLPITISSIKQPWYTPHRESCKMG